MIDCTRFCELALSFDATESKPHFDRTAFKVIKKRTFATLHEPSNTANLKLQPAEQAVFCDFGEAVYPVPNKWGEQGWTTFELARVPESLLFNALETAYAAVIKKK